VLRRTQASLGHKEGVDPKVAADGLPSTRTPKVTWKAGERL